VTNGDVEVDRVIVAADTGEVIHPDALEAQLESGVIYGLTAALYGEITIDQGAVVESNFPQYEMVRLATAPDIVTILAPTAGAPLGGAGEIGTPPIAPALTNAIFQATGERVRDLPVRKNGIRPIARRRDRKSEGVA
ncbi:MAG: molybdopterin cofactor-binding domain-containing protein, partial [Myxococcota bacterium]